MGSFFFKLLFDQRRRQEEAVPLLSLLAGWLLALLLVALVFTFAFQQLQYGWNWGAVLAYRLKLLQGWLTTVVISAIALCTSLVFGLASALVRRCPFLPARSLGTLYVELIRGTPLLVQILIFFYVVADAFGITDRYLVGVLTLSLFSGAYISEIIRAGIESVGESQLESARAIGLTGWQTYRYIVFPQVLRR